MSKRTLSIKPETVNERRNAAVKMYHSLYDPMKEGRLTKFQAKQEVSKEFGLSSQVLNMYLKRWGK